jgi:hypothetical protein
MYVLFPNINSLNGLSVPFLEPPKKTHFVLKANRYWYLYSIFLMILFD